ncbi:MAG: tryptophan-rich sensory protein, partial [Bacteroidales bacterium]|nr:tryptophan-rich sensory protein [Bacteroidales bacterium]
MRLIICFSLGFIARRLQSSAIEEWYPNLIKPSLTPPNIIFPIAWNILYVCMSISIGLILIKRTYKRDLIILFIVQLILNFGWSLCFFYFRNPLLGLIDIFLLDIVVIFYALKAYEVSKWSSYLFIPYI